LELPSLGKLSFVFFLASHIPPYFLKIPIITGWLMAAAGGAFYMPLATRSSHTAMMGIGFSISPNGLGTMSAVALSNTYHPGNERGFGPAARQVGCSVATDMGFDVLREFWPEIAHKLNIPFRGKTGGEGGRISP
jgi:hypothetical protein